MTIFACVISAQFDARITSHFLYRSILSVIIRGNSETAIRTAFVVQWGITTYPLSKNYNLCGCKFLHFDNYDRLQFLRYPPSHHHQTLTHENNLTKALFFRLKNKALVKYTKNKALVEYENAPFTVQRRLYNKDCMARLYMHAMTLCNAFVYKICRTCNCTIIAPNQNTGGS